MLFSSPFSPRSHTPLLAAELNRNPKTFPRSPFQWVTGIQRKRGKNRTNFLSIPAVGRFRAPESFSLCFGFGAQLGGKGHAFPSSSSRSSWVFYSPPSPIVSICLWLGEVFGRQNNGRWKRMALFYCNGLREKLGKCIII